MPSSDDLLEQAAERCGFVLPTALAELVYNEMQGARRGVDNERTLHESIAREVLLALDMVSVNAIGACDEHYPLARRIAGDRFVQQHTFAALCAWPGVLWSFKENRCVLDDSGVEQSAREFAEASA
jgi:hypothetical protein